MPGCEQLIHPAATVVILRDGDAGLEVLMLRRNSKLAFYGGAWVFPGGRIDETDRAAAVDGDALSAARLAAVRETREEAGLLVAPDDLVYFAQWLTPPGRPRRFDTWYFAVLAPPGSVIIDRGEVHDHRWMRPQEALDARDLGEIELPPPTFVTLWQLAEFPSARAAYAALSDQEVVRYVPRPIPVDGGTVFLYAEDAGYEDRNPDASGPRHRITAIGTSWRYERRPAAVPREPTRRSRRPT